MSKVVESEHRLYAKDPRTGVEYLAATPGSEIDEAEYKRLLTYNKKRLAAAEKAAPAPAAPSAPAPAPAADPDATGTTAPTDPTGADSNPPTVDPDSSASAPAPAVAAEPEENLADMSYDALKEKAKALGIEFKGNIGRAGLTKLIVAKEA